MSSLKLQYLEIEIKINIFKFIDSPINLALSCKSWSIIAKDPYVKAKWLLHRASKAHAFFYGIKLGPTFMNEAICKILFAKKVVFSRYFIQRLMLQFATCFPKSVYPNGEPWAYNVRLDTLFSILKQGEVQYGEELTLRGNDMDKFYHLSGGPLLIMNVHTLLIKNLEEIKKLIINKKFIPFPPTRRLYFYSGYHVDYNLEKFPPFDGYEQEGNLNIIARAILFKPELINTWKSIGYSEVCDDFNEVVIHGLFLTLDPPSQVQHAFEKLVLNLEKFIEMGFRLTDRIIVDVLQFYEYELAELGEFLWRVFRSIRTGESDFTFIFGLFKVAFDPNRCHEKDDIFIFLKSKTTHHENFLRQILGQHFNRENLDDINFNIRKKSLIFSPIIYEFVIKNYDSDSDLSLMCFKDTLALRIYYDDPNNGKFANKISIRLIKDIYDYFKIRIDYLPEHMELLRRAKSADIVKPFLEDFVPNVFLSNDDIKKSIWFNAIHSLKGDDYFNNYLLRLIEYFEFNG